MTRDRSVPLSSSVSLRSTSPCGQPGNAHHRGTEKPERNGAAKALFLLAALFIVSLAPTATAQTRSRIVILKNRNMEQFNLAAEGFKRGLQQAKIPVLIVEYTMTEGARELTAKINQFKPDLIAPLGSTAATFAREQFGHIPIVFAMVLYPSMSGIDPIKPPPNITGVSMDIPILRQFQTILSIVPRTRTIAVLYDPRQTGRVIEDAREAARAAGVELLAIQIRSEKDVPAAMQGLERRADVLWTVADSTVFTPATTEFIIVYAMQHDLPMMGLSAEFADGGALFALGQDFVDIGRAAAESAVRILAGTPPSALPISTPRKTSLIVNMRVAEEIGLRIPEDVIRKASRIIR